MLARIAASAVICVLFAGPAGAADPWADSVLSYEAGALDAGDTYNVPSAVLGSPARTTVGWATTDFVTWTTYEESVRLSAPPYQDYTTSASTVLKVGAGGHLVVGFDERVENEAGNPFGIDLLIFTNAGLVATDWPDNKMIADPVFAFGGTLGTIRVSQDNAAWYTAVGLGPNFPMQAYRSDAWNAFATGAAPSDYSRPVDPSLSLDAFGGKSMAEILSYYNRSGGGLGVDLSNLLDADGNAAGLPWIQYLRIEGATNAIDGFSDVAVPEPATMGLLAIGGAALLARRRRGA